MNARRNRPLDRPFSSSERSVHDRRFFSHRTLKALKQLGVVEVDGRIFRIPDWPRLAAIAEFEPDSLQMVAPAEEAA